MTKVCPNPHCEAVYHNCTEHDKHCADCGTTIRTINEHTYWKKFAHNWFQYDFQTGEIFRPVKPTAQLQLEFC